MDHKEFEHRGNIDDKVTALFRGINCMMFNIQVLLEFPGKILSEEACTKGLLAKKTARLQDNQQRFATLYPGNHQVMKHTVDMVQ